MGATLPKRDAVDERIIKTVITGQAIPAPDAEEFETPYVKRRLPADSYKSGIITHIQQVGGLPEYKGEPYLDSDMDGMPDAWEKANKLNPNDPSDAILDCNGDGYTNIEKYLNGIDTRKKSIDQARQQSRHPRRQKQSDGPGKQQQQYCGYCTNCNHACPAAFPA